MLSLVKHNVNLIVSEGDSIMKQKGTEYTYNHIGRSQEEPFTRIIKKNDQWVIR